LKTEEIKLAGSNAFLELEKDYNVKTTFDFLMYESDCFAVKIITTNQSLAVENSKLVPSMDYLINVFKVVKRFGSLIGYTPTFNKLTTLDDALVYHNVCFYFLFEINE
jgi:hypothetical protein